ncbi:MAG: hypothetical protein K0S70_211 [Microbacterium sp.]|nr:hypothetical protein [Microbacterium sp.]
MAEDPELRQQVELAERLGVSFKRLSGWEPTTTYVYDDAGRRVSSTPESEWDETEVEWLLALERWRRENLCPLCGYPNEVCQAPYGTFVYGAEEPTRCNVTDALRSAQNAVKDRPNRDALIWRPQVRPWGSPAS